MAFDREEGWDVDLFSHEAPWEAFYSALGRLVQMFGLCEVKLNTVLRSIAFDILKIGADTRAYETLEAMTGPMRIAPLRDSIKRILRVANVSQKLKADFDATLAQLGEIHFFRDRICHHGTRFSNQAKHFYTANDETVAEYTQGEVLIFEIEDLLDMAYDLTKIRSILEILSHNVFQEVTGQTDFIEQPLPTWRYKPSALKREGPKHWTKSPKLQPQPLPSKE